MKNPKILNRLIMLLLCVIAYGVSNAQSAKRVHRWHNYNKKIVMTQETANSFQGSPEADYTPPNNIETWEAKDKLHAYAKSSTGAISLFCVLTVDETGKITNIKTVKSNNKTASDAIVSLIKNTKTGSPSYLHNEAVASYVPCQITITKNQITIL